MRFKSGRKIEEPVVVTITGPDGDEKDFAEDVVIPYDGKTSRFLYRFPNRKTMIKNRKLFWRGLILTKRTESRYMCLRRMRNMTLSPLFMMKCKKRA